METLKASERHAVHPAGRGDGAGDARRLCLPRARHRAPQEPGQRAGEDPGRLRRVDGRVFLHRLRGGVRHDVLRRRRDAGAEERLRAREVLLPADVRRRDPGDRVGRHRRARASSIRSLRRPFLLVGFVYPFFEGIAWNRHFGIQAWIKGTFGEEFHDFAGSVVVHAMGGWVGAGGGADARRAPRPLHEGWRHQPRIRRRSIPFLALGAWVLSVGWFGFNVMSGADASTRSPAWSR